MSPSDLRGMHAADLLAVVSYLGLSHLSYHFFVFDG